jgi:hypothetical protein
VNRTCNSVTSQEKRGFQLFNYWGVRVTVPSGVQTGVVYHDYDKCIYGSYFGEFEKQQLQFAMDASNHGYKLYERSLLANLSEVLCYMTATSSTSVAVSRLLSRPLFIVNVTAVLYKIRLYQSSF